ncbi:MAG: glutathione S-transferase family protein [Hyphomicrobiales bacterium]|nr:glutathione S-transferase family protein [Hyphomicrobiales bacterium]
MRTLYDFPPSGNCHKIRIMLSILGLDYDKVTINLLKGEQKAPEFLQLNPRHKVPVLDDEGIIVADSAAILIYLSRKYGRDDLYPNEPAAMAEIQKWLSFSVNEVFNGLALSRARVIFKRDVDAEPLHAIAFGALKTMEAQLKEADWLALGQPTIADIACYPYTAAIGEAGLSLEPYPAVRAWLTRLEALPGFVAMPAFEPLDQDRFD